MRYIKHDSDEWLRKAAEEYQVQPFGMNWDFIANEIKEEAHVSKFQNYAFVRYAAMIVFFMLLSLICNKYIRLDFDKRYAASYVVSPINETNNGNTHPNKGNHLSVGIEINKYYKNEQRLRAITERNLLATQQNDALNIKRKESLLSLNGGSNMISNHSIVLADIAKARPTIFTTSDNFIQEGDIDKDKKKKLITRQRLYAGILLGPDMSSIKNQKINDIGYNLGLFVGYRFNKKWLLETGLLINRKAYYTDGYYFNAGKVYLPQHAEMLNVEGYCNMFEIPLNVRYIFFNKLKSQWSATAGVSSYIMTNEDYDYRYIRYGNKYEVNKVYKNASKDWLSAINVGIGYEHTIGRKLQVRIEPYYKVPLRGMGTGKLPISSTGMNVGVSYPIK